jgi:hypothetical protein
MEAKKCGLKDDKKYNSDAVEEKNTSKKKQQ